MKNTINKQVESLKKNIDSASLKSKETIKTLVDTNSRQFDSAIDANSKTFNSISKMLYEKEMDPSIVSSFKSTFGKSIKLSEDTIDSIIDSHTRRMDLSTDFMTRFLEIIQNEDVTTKEGVEKLIELVKENFDKSVESSIQNMEKTVSLYNDHLNLALNFNKKFADNISSQINAMFSLQKKNMDSFFSGDMVSEWWKTESKEKVKV
jgi:hypothetical protein